MTPVKKIEIVVDALEIDEVLRALDRAGVSGYTVIREVTGRGDRGVRRGDELTGVFKNGYVMTACPEELVEAVVAAVRPILTRFGGIALVSDAQWVKH
jgi:nitrogen regulatory protein PII